MSQATTTQVNPARIVSDNGSQIVVTIPAGRGTVNVTVTTAGGTSTPPVSNPMANQYSYQVYWIGPTSGNWNTASNWDTGKVPGALDNVTINPGIPVSVVPPLLPASRPVHSVVAVDVFLPGCPPSADLIYSVLDELLAGRVPDTAGITHFGA